MFSAVLFAQDQTGARAIEQAAFDSKQVCIYRSMNTTVSPYALTRLLNSFKPDIIFVDLSQRDSLLLARTARLISRDAAVIGFTETPDEEKCRVATHAGISEVLSGVLTVQKFEEAVQHAIRTARPGIEDNLVAFLPAKAGSGSTTLAVNLAGSMARDHERKVLVMDADVHSGTVAVALKLSPEYSLLDALESAGQLDGTLWSRIVTQAHGLDFLVNTRIGERRMVQWSNYHQLLQFARPRYDAIFVDLPEVVNDATIEVVRRARQVFLVATPELPALVLARQRAQKLEASGIAPERIGIILNRWTSSEIDVLDVERFVERRLAAVFENDYRCVRRALQEGRMIGKKSELGRSLSGFAEKLAGLERRGLRPKASPGFLESLFPKKTSPLHTETPVRNNRTLTA